MDENEPQGLIASVTNEAEVPDQVWLEFREGSPPLLAASLKQRGARLIGLTAYPLDYPQTGEAMVCYHFAVPAGSGESMFSVKFATANRLLPSIADLYPGAGWQEQALGERYHIGFNAEAAPVAGMLTS